MIKMEPDCESWFDNGGVPSLSGSYDASVFRDRYQRNNKRGGLKNLRCFPTCSETHKERGFCGRSVFVTVHHDRGKEFMARAEFVTVEKNNVEDPINATGVLNLKVGDQVPLDRVLPLDRGKEEPTKPYLRGDLVPEKSGSCTSVFEFNRDRKGWHYGWASNKHTCNSFHTLQTYIMEKTYGENGECMLTVRLVVRSPHFMLFCRRRRRFKILPTAPIAVPVRSTKKEPVLVTPKNQICTHDQQGGMMMKSPRKRKLAGTSSIAPSPDLQTKKARSARKKRIDIHRLNMMLRGVANMIANIKFDNQTLSSSSFLESTPMSNHHQQQHQLQQTPPPSQHHQPHHMDQQRWGSSTSHEIDLFSSSLADCIDLFENQHQHGSESDEHMNLDLHDLDMSSIEDDQGFFNTLPPLDGFGPGQYDMNSSTVFSAMELDKSKIIEGLAFYLLNETGFTKSIQSLNLNENPRPGKSKEYRAFVNVLERNVEGFMAKHNMTLEQFDRVFDICPTPNSQSTDRYMNSEESLASIPDLCAALGSGGELFASNPWPEDVGSFVPVSEMKPKPSNHLMLPPPLVSSSSTATIAATSSASSTKKKKKGTSFLDDVYGAFASLMRSKKADKPKTMPSIMLGSPIASGPSHMITPFNVPDHSGVWERTDEGTNEMVEIRVKSGIPWILSKMFEYMESKFEIEQDGLNMKCRMRRKLLSNGTLNIELDNVERPFGLQLPILTAMSQNWRHRGFVDREKIYLVHTIGAKRITRVNWLSEDNQTLHSLVILEMIDIDNGEFVEVSRVQLKSVRGSSTPYQA